MARAVIVDSADCSEEESELGRGRRQKKQKQAALDDDDASQSNAPKRRKLMCKVRHDRSLSSDVLQKLKVLRENQSVIVFLMLFNYPYDFYVQQGSCGWASTGHDSYFEMKFMTYNFHFMA